MLPTFVERLLEKTSHLDTLFVKLERPKQQLVSLMGEQNQEIRGLREDIATSKRPEADADIEQMVDDASNTETIDDIFFVGGTHETTSEVSVANIKETTAQLLRNAKNVNPAITVSSELLSK